MAKFRVKAGQFMIFRFLAKGYWWEAHPFSMSKLPDGKGVRITVKAVGDFTSKLQDIKAGTKVIVDGPYGIFTDIFGISSKVLLIAGGIGITPIRSLMEEMLRKGKDVTLFYANRSKNDIVFQNELEELRKLFPARIIHVLSAEAEWNGEKGYIDEEKIRRFLPDISEREVYICGPVPMMESLVKILKNSFKLPISRIHFEKFSF